MKKIAVLGSVLGLVLVLGLVGWWKFGGFYTVSVINIFNLQSRLGPSAFDDPLARESFGGAALLASAVRELKRKQPAALVTESGDLVMGPWWRLWFGEPEFKTAGQMGVAAGILGNHEFNLGPGHLKKALSLYAAFPILATNIDFQDPELADLVEKRLLLTAADGIKIGLFSLVPPQLAAKIKNGDTLKIDPDLAAVAARNIKMLQAEGAQAVVLLTHSGLEEDLALAAEVEGLSLIISGDGNYGSEARIHWVEGPGGWSTAVAVGGDNGRSLSSFTLTMHRGRPVAGEAAVDTVRLASGLSPDPEIAALVSDYAGRMDEMLHRPIGFFATPVDARRDFVRRRPAPIGTFIADAFRWKTKADIAIINAGGIRGDRIFPSGPITTAMVMEMLPFHNYVQVKEMTGKDIRLMLEYSASALTGRNDEVDAAARIDPSGFLHFSGLSVTFALGPVNRPLSLTEGGEIDFAGNRLKFAGLFNEGAVSPLNDTQVYSVAMPDFMAQGGDRYNFLKTIPVTGLQALDYEAVAEYLAARQSQPLSLKTDGRLRLED